LQEIRLLASPHLSAFKSSNTAERIFMKFDMGGAKICLRIPVLFKRTTITANLREDLHAFLRA
jgi:hypothetical protein